MSATDSGFTAPNNVFLIQGRFTKHEVKVETATNFKPCRLAKKGTSDGQAVVNDGAIAIGWIGYEQAADQYRPGSIDTAYAANAFAPIIHCPGAHVRAILADQEAVAKGDPLKATAAGELAKATVGTDHVYAIAMESKTASPATAIIVESLI